MDQFSTKKLDTKLDPKLDSFFAHQKTNWTHQFGPKTMRPIWRPIWAPGQIGRISGPPNGPLNEHTWRDAAHLAQTVGHWRRAICRMHNNIGIFYEPVQVGLGVSELVASAVGKVDVIEEL